MNEKDYGCEAEVKIANEVVSKIAAIAALEVEGVCAMGNNITTEIMGKVGMRNILKNVKTEFANDEVTITILVTVGYGYNIPATSQKVQSKVKQAIENMTGLNVRTVNVRIAGICVAGE